MTAPIASLTSDNALLEEDYGRGGRSKKKGKAKGKKKRTKKKAIPAAVDRQPSRIYRAMRP